MGDDCTCHCFARVRLAADKGFVCEQTVLSVSHDTTCKSFDGECCDCDPIVLISYSDLTLSVQDDGSVLPLHDGEEMVRN